MQIKTVLFLLVFLVGYTALQAQRFKGGLIAGGNFSQIDGDDLAGFHKVGISGGGYVAAILADRWQLSIEMLFSQQGSKWSQSDGLSAAFDKIALNFVEVPVLLNFEEWKFHVQAGASYGRLINSSVISITGEDVSESIDLNPNIFSYVIGVTFFSNEKLGYNFRWFKAFNDLQAQEGSNRWLGRSFSLRVLYLFN